MNDITIPNYYARVFKLADGTELSLSKSDTPPFYFCMTIRQMINGVQVETTINIKGRFAKQKRDKLFKEFTQAQADINHTLTAKNYNNMLQ
jgi:hypothetical protein